MEEVPYDLYAAIEHANRICGWQENLLKDEMPPSWMWPIEDELELWFEEVDRKREEKYSGGEEQEESPMMRNELARGRK